MSKIGRFAIQLVAFIFFMLVSVICNAGSALVANHCDIPVYLYSSQCVARPGVKTDKNLSKLIQLKDKACDIAMSDGNKTILRNTIRIPKDEKEYPIVCQWVPWATCVCRDETVY